MFEKARALVEELRRVPSWWGVSFRGFTRDSQFGLSTRSAVARGLVPASRNLRMATENFTCAGAYAIVGPDGRAIESIAIEEDETRNLESLSAGLADIVRGQGLDPRYYASLDVAEILKSLTAGLAQDTDHWLNMQNRYYRRQLELWAAYAGPQSGPATPASRSPKSSRRPDR